MSIEKNKNDMPSPILIIGDASLSKKNIVAGKKRYNTIQWIEMSFSDYSVDEIRGEASSQNLFMQSKAIVLKDIPNQKAIREFIVSLINTQPNTKFVIWDSLNNIKPDSKKGIFNKTWSTWINEIKGIKNSKFINNGFETNQEKDVIPYIIQLFSKKKISCNNDVARLFYQIIGSNRGIINSEVNKLALVVNGKVEEEDILNYAYPITQDAIIYKLGNALDSNNYSNVISTLEDFLNKKVHPNVLSEILMKRARWQLIVLDKWAKGVAWSQIERELLAMGKFPSTLQFRDRVILSEQKKIKKELSSPDKAKEYMVNRRGMPEYYFERLEGKGVKLKKSERLPLPFVATQVVNYVKDIIVFPNVQKNGLEEFKSVALQKGIKQYLAISECLKCIRYGDDAKTKLYEMIRYLMDN